MFSATFIFAKRHFDEEFHTLDARIAEVARGLPGLVRGGDRLGAPVLGTNRAGIPTSPVGEYRGRMYEVHPVDIRAA